MIGAKDVSEELLGNREWIGRSWTQNFSSNYALYCGVVKAVKSSPN
jgi:hypothetical protein